MRHLKCGIFYRTYKSNFMANMTTKVKYLELFELHNHDGAATFATNGISYLKKKGYSILDAKQQDNSTITLFTNGSDVIMLQAFTVMNQLFIAFAGSMMK
ncbi:hypothetical protein [Deinococcus cellulosilyticus]|uniref:Uncharacterized protein n=1 Tax=Deinococcus cellulosilyticus (strain DSM 18568 / NBRC 106333 / KACC 11606 / 5516J-15) TaxID=1223518 RepID=A0A511N9Z3_DEIC1|nr:hypothetical protein [Deinococcus cellulosilyticus]GEM49318.1 hypothetical protein DC3_49530 [Deinococcus cellulosilyticus NBRC 106333 = KACC 11606]